jgi:YD repeat-containing protein
MVTEKLTSIQANNVTPIDLGSREYKYDRVNNRIETTDRNGRTTNYEYDNLNRITTEAWADGSKTFTYSYDKNGNRLTADDGKIKYVNTKQIRRVGRCPRITSCEAITSDRSSINDANIWVMISSIDHICLNRLLTDSIV